MTPEKFALLMRAVHPKAEDAHQQGDELLLEALRQAGYGDGVAAFELLRVEYHDEARIEKEVEEARTAGAAEGRDEGREALAEKLLKKAEALAEKAGELESLTGDLVTMLQDA